MVEIGWSRSWIRGNALRLVEVDTNSEGDSVAAGGGVAGLGDSSSVPEVAAHSEGCSSSGSCAQHCGGGGWRRLQSNNLKIVSRGSSCYSRVLSGDTKTQSIESIVERGASRVTWVSYTIGASCCGGASDVRIKADGAVSSLSSDTDIIILIVQMILVWGNWGGAGVPVETCDGSWNKLILKE